MAFDRSAGSLAPRGDWGPPPSFADSRPLPLFFAGRIFSTSFKVALNPAALFGAIFLGATLGGFREYLGRWTGSQAPGWLVIAAPAGSLVSRLQLRPGAAAGGQPRIA